MNECTRRSSYTFFYSPLRIGSTTPFFFFTATPRVNGDNPFPLASFAFPFSRVKSAQKKIFLAERLRRREYLYGFSRTPSWSLRSDRPFYPRANLPIKSYCHRNSPTSEKRRERCAEYAFPLPLGVCPRWVFVFFFFLITIPPGRE